MHDSLMELSASRLRASDDTAPLNLDSDSRQLLAKLVEVLSQKPTKAPQECRRVWEKIGSFKIREHLIDGKIKLNPNNEVKKQALYGYHGQIDSNQKWSGVGRYEFTDYIYEGEYSEDNLNGFGRQILKTGEVYQGFWKDGAMCGEGELIRADGSTVSGIWKDGNLV